MADVTTEFKKFHEKILLSTAQETSLRRSRDAIRERIRKHFRDVLEADVPKFHQQGSFAMRTTVQPLDGEFDIDDGVYFLHLDKDKAKWPTPATVHGWLVDATDDHTDSPPQDKNSCVRVRFKREYHVDLPSYGEHDNKFYLAHKTKGWVESDPKALTEWFRKQVKPNEQFRRIVRYLKAWADHQERKLGKMPSGLILSVLAANDFVADDRDDIALSKTVAAIKEKVTPVVYVTNPVAPSEELSARLNADRKKRFTDAIAEFAKTASEAVDEKSEKAASKKWQEMFGDRFPLAEDRAAQKKADAAALVSALAASTPMKPWAFLG